MKIVSHNAFWFQGAPFAPAQPGPPDPDVLDRLLVIYRGLAPDVLCLQEIQSEDALAQVADALGMRGAYCPGGALTQYGTAVLWKAGRMLADSRAAAHQVQRAWQIAEAPCADGRALRVANVHLPSARQVGAEGAARVRSEEMAALLDLSERPEVVVGDFNEQPGGGISKVLGARGYLDAAEITGQTEAPTTGGGGRLDQAWVLRSMQGRLVGYGVAPEAALRQAQGRPIEREQGHPERSRGAAMRTDIPAKKHLSDHFPVWVELV